MKKVRICHVTSVHPPFDGRIFEKECCSLYNAGYEVYLIAPNAINQIKNGVNFVGVPYKNKGRLWRIFIYSQLIYKQALSVNADVYHLHDPELLLYAIKLKRRGKIVIFDSHEDIPNQIYSKDWIPFNLQYTIAALYCKLEKCILEKIDALITVNSKIAIRLKKINPNTCIVTNYPVLKQPIPVLKKKRAICFTGNIKPEYMHENILIALSKLNDVKYVLAGKGELAYLQKLQLNKFWKYVDYRGYVSSDEVADICRNSVLGVVLHDYSLNVGGHTGSLGFVKLFEYMSAGIPIVCTDFVLIKDLIDTYQCGICVDPHDINAIVQAVDYFMENPAEAYRMGSNGRKAVEEVYNWSTQENVLLEMYSKVLKK